MLFLLIPVGIIVIFYIHFKKIDKIKYIDKEYLHALNTADRYLYAWVTRDGSIAHELVSNNIKKNFIDLQDFQMYFAGVSNPHHQAFEIIGYERLSNYRIRFKVWLYEDYTGIDFEPFKRPKPYYLELIKAGKEKWLVDDLRESAGFP